MKAYHEITYLHMKVIENFQKKNHIWVFLKISKIC